jgi:hypothetical protein
MPLVLSAQRLQPVQTAALHPFFGCLRLGHHLDRSPPQASAPRSALPAPPSYSRPASWQPARYGPSPAPCHGANAPSQGSIARPAPAWSGNRPPRPPPHRPLSPPARSPKAGLRHSAHRPLRPRARKPREHHIRRL